MCFIGFRYARSWGFFFLGVNNGSNKTHKIFKPFSVVDVRRPQVRRAEDVTVEDEMIGRLLLGATDAFGCIIASGPQPRGAFGGNAPANNFCDLTNCVVPRKICFKHTLKTKTSSPKNYFVPPNLKTGVGNLFTITARWHGMCIIPGRQQNQLNLS